MRYNGEMDDVFGAVAEDYDRWYDSPDGSSIFNAELACLRMVSPGSAGQWLEVGVGTGRFAKELGVEIGIDPSPLMLSKAAQRGVCAATAIAERLPFRCGIFDGVLMVAALCFIQDPTSALLESFRVLHADGKLIIGHIPADSSWGRAYMRKAEAGHPLYSHARFSTVNQLLKMTRAAGFTMTGSASTLLDAPDTTPDSPRLVKPGIAPEAGFVGFTFVPA
ncbi:MAG: class I SAM-dependent methyltransferase [Dehalococcoidia bacterium]|nr:class I SAM-dependent methyltransferase [Dehalococcoidia bacterium]